MRTKIEENAIEVSSNDYNNVVNAINNKLKGVPSTVFQYIIANIDIEHVIENEPSYYIVNERLAKEELGMTHRAYKKVVDELIKSKFIYKKVIITRKLGVRCIYRFNSTKIKAEFGMDIITMIETIKWKNVNNSIVDTEVGRMLGESVNSTTYNRGYSKMAVKKENEVNKIDPYKQATDSISPSNKDYRRIKNKTSIKNKNIKSNINMNTTPLELSLKSSSSVNDQIVLSTLQYRSNSKTTLTPIGLSTKSACVFGLNFRPIDKEKLDSYSLPIVKFVLRWFKAKCLMEDCTPRHILNGCAAIEKYIDRGGQFDEQFKRALMFVANFNGEPRGTMWWCGCLQVLGTGMNLMKNVTGTRFKRVLDGYINYVDELDISEERVTKHIGNAIEYANIMLSKPTTESGKEGRKEVIHIIDYLINAIDEGAQELGSHAKWATHSARYADVLVEFVLKLRSDIRECPMWYDETKQCYKYEKAIDMYISFLVRMQKEKRNKNEHYNGSTLFPSAFECTDTTLSQEMRRFQAELKATYGTTLF